MTNIRQELRDIILAKNERCLLPVTDPPSNLADTDAALDLLLWELRSFKASVSPWDGSNSRYIRFNDRRLGVLRVSDHPDGYLKLRSNWNLRFDLHEAYSVRERGATRHYYPAREALSLCRRIREEAQHLTRKHRR